MSLQMKMQDWSKFQLIKNEMKHLYCFVGCMYFLSSVVEVHVSVLLLFF